MLRELILENFILIRSLHLNLKKGFTVFTGETGAGKSLLVRAMKLLMGQRYTGELLSNDARQLTIQGVFEIDEEKRGSLAEIGITIDDNILIIKRIFSKDKPSRTYINGMAVTLSELKQVACGLLSIAGQHEYHGLLKSDAHYDWLDMFGGLMELRREVSRLYNDVRSLEGQRDELLSRLEAVNEKRQILTDKIKEIEAVAPQEGEDDRIEGELSTLKEASLLKELSYAAYNLLYGMNNSCEGLLSRALETVERLSDIDENALSLAGRIDSALTEIKDIAFELQRYHDSIRDDAYRIEELEARLNAIRRLLLRHGPTIEDCLKTKEEMEKELIELKKPQKAVASIEDELSKKRRHLLRLAKELSEKRKEASIALEKRVNKGLKGLFTHKCAFFIVVDTPVDITDSNIGQFGIDKVRFMFSPNTGIEPMPIEKIASGGELSRVMLALRIALSDKLQTGTILFDEIDAGIGGKTANFIGERLKLLGKTMQVMCVSHFPQVAAMADNHFKVIKEIRGERTETSIIELKEKKQRLSEFTRMLGAETEEAKEYANFLIKRGMEAKCQ